MYWYQRVTTQLVKLMTKATLHHQIQQLVKQQKKIRMLHISTSLKKSQKVKQLLLTWMRRVKRFKNLVKTLQTHHMIHHMTLLKKVKNQTSSRQKMVRPIRSYRRVIIQQVRLMRMDTLKSLTQLQVRLLNQNQLSLMFIKK